MRDDLTIALISGGSAIVGGIVGGLLSGAYQHFRDWYNRPQLKVDYKGVDGANVVHVNYKQDVHDIAEIYIRARVENAGRRVAKGCLVFWQV